jgi:hypothetical protein
VWPRKAASRPGHPRGHLVLARVEERSMTATGDGASRHSETTGERPPVAPDVVNWLSDGAASREAGRTPPRPGRATRSQPRA